jgi:hypothetical protein
MPDDQNSIVLKRFGLRSLSEPGPIELAVLFCFFLPFLVVLVAKKGSSIARHPEATFAYLIAAHRAFRIVRAARNRAFNSLAYLAHL